MLGDHACIDGISWRDGVNHKWFGFLKTEIDRVVDGDGIGLVCLVLVEMA